ncbi:MAG: electron-transferring-flavoprotein dehydrogenase [Candidatus Tokpelaia sp. JSC085]|nr:MAG: electron-transferring-flavoprotein dehydrogenase [Candidatus Tokpelaia sp. JSC085]
MHRIEAREIMECDVVIVGAGPAGLAAAIRLKQSNPTLSIVILEKGAEVGAHILSGAVVDPVGIATLLPEWHKEDQHPFRTMVKEERLMFLTARDSWMISKILLPKIMSNHGSFIVSLGRVCRWLARKAEALGVDIYPGFSGVELLYNDVGAVTGVATVDMALMSKYVLIGEGARGSLAKKLIARYALDTECSPQKYGIGFKELWEVDSGHHRPGLVQHSFGWPLDNCTGGGSFLYHLEENQVSVGFVVHLDYKNPYLSPFEEFQRFKTHPSIRDIFAGARRISYGARAITEGGFQSVPRLAFPGGALIGCSAGFVNVPRIKGFHNAVLSGIIVAEHIAMAVAAGRSNDEIKEIEKSWRASAIGRDLFPARNVKPLMAKYGTIFGCILSGFDMWLQQLFSFSLFGTMRHPKTDAAALEPAFMHQPVDYPAPDNVLTFDRLSSVYISNTSHKGNEPCHLRLKDTQLQKTSELNSYNGPSTRYCPASVYEWIGEDENSQYMINAQNCIHCKTCDIKDPNQNIEWNPPSGGGGPLYFDM